jgi:hypothetical protein
MYTMAMQELSTLYAPLIADASTCARLHQRGIVASSRTTSTGGSNVQAAAAATGLGSAMHLKGSGSYNDWTGTSHFSLSTIIGTEGGYRASGIASAGPISETIQSSGSNPRSYSKCAAGGL